MRFAALALATALAFFGQPAGAADGLRDPAEIPFASDSVWNLPLGSGAQWQYNAQLVGLGLRVKTQGNYNEPIYVSTAADPLVTITSLGTWGEGVVRTFQAHVPANAQPSYPHPGDLTMTVFDTTDNTWNSGGQWAWTGPNSATVDAWSKESVFGDGISWDHSNWNQGVGTLRASDLAKGSIDHMLRAMLPTDILYSPNPNTVNQLVPYAWPGTREDSFANCNCIPFPGLTSYTGTIGFGVTIGIPINTPEPSAIQASPGAHMLWKQMQTHGLMVRDSTHVGLGVLQLQTDQGVPSSNPLIQQMMQFGKQILSNARLLVNQGPNSINGGGTPVVPLIPPLRGANPPPPDVTIGTGASTHSRATGQPALTRSQ